MPEVRDSWHALWDTRERYTSQVYPNGKYYYKDYWQKDILMEIEEIRIKKMSMRLSHLFVKRNALRHKIPYHWCSHDVLYVRHLSYCQANIFPTTHTLHPRDGDAEQQKVTR